jgi:aarF domain-containing kinase
MDAGIRSGMRAVRNACRATLVGRGIPSVPSTSRHALTSNLFSQARRVHSSEFSPLKPPDPSSLPKPRVRNPAKRRRWTRRFLYVSGAFGTVYFLDTYFYDAVLSRSFRTFKDGLVIGLDYKINFRQHPWFVDSLEDLHTRSATRIFRLLHENGGLYLKIGQAIAMQSAILPPAFQKMFSRMFDDAPQNSWKDVEKVIREDFGGRSVEEVFGVSFAGEEGKGVMERRARASASVAQVHWARLADGREVAIKIQKREINRQVSWDLWAFK